MDSLFHPDSKPMQVMHMVFNLMVVNTLTILFSFPIVTMGTAFSAMHAICLKIVRDEDVFLLKDYWKAFRSSLRGTIGVWLCVLCVYFLLAYDINLIRLGVFELNIWGVGVLAVLSVLFGMWSMWYIVLESRYENTVKRTAQNAMILTIKYFAKSLLMFVIGAIPVLILASGSWLIIAVFFFCFSICGCFQARIYGRVFMDLENTDVAK